VARGLECLSVLDVSGTALARARLRLGAAGERVRWIEADVTAPAQWYSDPADVWHDRAVFHFLTSANERAHYVARARRQIKPGGHLVLATFAPDGPAQCSGLPVRRYDAAGLSAELGASFTLERWGRNSHRTPAGCIMPFTYAAFRFEGLI
jgi:SAM-dependent methyltransferase